MLRGGLGLAPDPDVALAAGGADADPEPLIVLPVDLDVAARVGAHDVADHPVGALGGVGAHGEQRRVVVRPHQPVAELGEAASGRRHAWGVEHLTALDVDDGQ